MAGRSLNKAMLIGNLGKDADLRYTSTGRAVATFSIATSESFKSGDSNDWQERTEWHNIVVWGKTAESTAEYLTKGKKVYIEGRLQTRNWDDQNGNKHYTTEIVARELILLGGRGESSPAQSQRPPHPADSFANPNAPTHTGAAPAAPADPHEAPPVAEDDIPF